MEKYNPDKEYTRGDKVTHNFHNYVAERPVPKNCFPYEGYYWKDTFAESASSFESKDEDSCISDIIGDVAIGLGAGIIGGLLGGDSDFGSGGGDFGGGGASGDC